MIYDENGNIIENPDLTLGVVYNHHEKDGTVKRIYRAFSEEELREKESADTVQTVTTDDVLNTLLGVE